MLRVCVIGMGAIGNKHAKAYVDSKRQSLGVCDIRRDRAEVLGRHFSVPYFLDAEEMLRELKPDICSVTTGGRSIQATIIFQRCRR